LHSGAIVLRERPRRRALARLCSYARLEDAIGRAIIGGRRIGIARLQCGLDAKKQRCRVQMLKATGDPSGNSVRSGTCLTAMASICGILAGSVMVDAEAAQASLKVAAGAASSDNPYAALAKLPDWSGLWEPLLFTTGAKTAPPAPPKLTPAYAKQYAAYQEKNRTTPGLNFVSNVANCVPSGLPGSMLQPYPIEFLFTPGRVTINIETYSVVRRVYTDGRSLPTDPDPSYQGTSVGSWEGNTLVIRTIGILPETVPIMGIIGHSSKMRVTERVHLSPEDLLQITTTVEDPSVFTEPYTFTTQYRRHRDWTMMEYVCAQNNHDSVDEHGNPGFSLQSDGGRK
jgi:hypothetical protein